MPFTLSIKCSRNSSRALQALAHVSKPSFSGSIVGNKWSRALENLALGLSQGNLEGLTGTRHVPLDSQVNGFGEHVDVETDQANALTGASLPPRAPSPHLFQSPRQF